MRTLGKYEVLEELGAGAMGKVFHARDRVLQREVAIKTISTEDADIELKQRFYREARACGRLSHPNIVTVFDLGEQQGVHRSKNIHAS
jgi:serine/threonine-protein kinase